MSVKPREDHEDAGYEVVTAAQGEAALGEVACRANPDASIVVTSGKHAPDDGDLPTGGRFVAKPYTAAQMR